MYSYLIPKLVKGIDIRKISDDMNPGSGNVIKYCGIPLGILCIILDLFKAFIPVFISVGAIPFLKLVVCPSIWGRQGSNVM